MTGDLPSYVVSSDKSLLRLEWIVRSLRATYWAGTRAPETIERSIAASVCFGAYEQGTPLQVGFARVVTDNATFSWVCDVFVDPAHRGRGVGKQLIARILEEPSLAGTTFLLGTRDAHGLYEKFGFARSKCMRRAAPVACRTV